MAPWHSEATLFAESGIAHLLGDPERAPICPAGNFAAGTIGYAAPEVLAGQAASVATDVFSLGAILYELLAGRSAYGDLDAAEEALRTACVRGPANPVAHRNLGSVLLRLERWSEAEEAYQRAVHLAPGVAGSWRGLARARIAQGRRQEGRDALLRALELDPRDALARRLLDGLDAAPLEAR